ncbi:MAG: hypothetical protein ACK5QT_10865 [Oligoflexia bacterium]
MTLGRAQWLLVAYAAFMALPFSVRADGVLQSRIDHDDRLGARVRVREIASGKLDAKTWRWLDLQVAAHPEWGEDLTTLVIDKAAEGRGWTEPLSAQESLVAGDEAMQAKRFNEAAQAYRAVLNGAQAAELLPGLVWHTRLALARALYAAKRFDEAYVEAKKIPAKFSRYRHVLFIRMWAAFRAGRVELALGEIAAQKSDYFGPTLEPESSLLLIYLLKRLCREAEALDVITQMDQVLSDLKSRKFGFKDWAKLEVGTRTFLEILNQPDPSRIQSKSMPARQRERAWIQRLLESSFEKKRAQWIDELPRVIAYSRLAITPGMGSALKPIEKISSREKLLEQGYEVWPLQGEEQWLDELNSYRYLGDSACAQK